MKFFILTRDGLYDEQGSSAAAALRKFTGTSRTDVLGIFDAKCVAQPPARHRGAYVAVTGEPLEMGRGHL